MIYFSTDYRHKKKSYEIISSTDKSNGIVTPRPNMNYSILFISLLILIGCDAPRRSRAPTTYINGSNFSDTGSQFISNPTTNPINGVSPTAEQGFESCDLTDKYYSVGTGHFGLCQNTLDETLFKFKPSLTVNSVKTCLIPTYKEQNGASTYLGNPQCTFTVSNQIIRGKLFKDRQGFNTYPINGVIVMPQSLINEYISCMHGYINWPGNACSGGNNTAYCAYWLPRCPNGAGSNQLCMTEGKNFMANLCNNFKSRYPNAYIDIRTKP